MKKNRGFTLTPKSTLPVLPSDDLHAYHRKRNLKSLNKEALVRGFTLIELLVVISIIGLLSSVVFASLTTARAKSRDARRKSDITQISKALEFYYDKYGGYPSSVCDVPSDTTLDYKIKNSLAAEIKMAEYLATFPKDPIAPGDCYNNQYLYMSDQYNTCGSGNNALATQYTLYATLEDQSTTNLSAVNSPIYDAWLLGGAQACGAPRSNFKVCSSGGCLP